MDLGLIIYALNLASIYALMAVGISILWSSVGMINMAHGATFAVAGYAAWLVTGALKPVIAASLGKTALASFAMAGALFASALIAGAICGVIIYALAFLPILQARSAASTKTRTFRPLTLTWTVASDVPKMLRLPLP